MRTLNPFYNIKINLSYLKMNASILLALFSLVFYSNAFGYDKKPDKRNAETIHFTVTVLDKNTSQPLDLVNVMLEKDNAIVYGAATNPAGKAFFSDVEVGTYNIVTHYLGYQNYSDTITIDRQHGNYSIEISEKSIELNAVVIQGNKNSNISTSIETVTGRQVFEGETYHAAPSTQMTTLIQENLAGAVRAPTGEVHIRGQHGEYSFMLDGVPVPLGVFGGLNEIVDPKIISRATFYTGGFPAEYGGQISSLIDMQTHVPAGRFHLNLSSFIGSYLTIE